MTTESNKIKKPATLKIMAMKDVFIHGNITPMIWYKRLRKKTKRNNTAYYLAIAILSDVIYWYTPTVVRCEKTSQIIGYARKPDGDLLQRSYKQIVEIFGCSPEQAKAALVYLENRKLIKRVFRTIQTDNGRKIPNVMFLDIDVEMIKLSLDEKNGYVRDFTHTPKSINSPIPSVSIHPHGTGDFTHTNTATTNTDTTIQEKRNKTTNVVLCEQDSQSPILQNSNSEKKEEKQITNPPPQKTENQIIPKDEKTKEEKRKKVAAKKEKDTEQQEAKKQTPQYDHPRDFTKWFWQTYTDWHKETYSETPSTTNANQWGNALKNLMKELTHKYRSSKKTHPSLEECKELVQNYFNNLPQRVIEKKYTILGHYKNLHWILPEIRKAMEVKILQSKKESLIYEQNFLKYRKYKGFAANYSFTSKEWLTVLPSVQNKLIEFYGKSDADTFMTFLRAASVHAPMQLSQKCDLTMLDRSFQTISDLIYKNTKKGGGKKEMEASAKVKAIADTENKINELLSKLKAASQSVEEMQKTAKTIVGCIQIMKGIDPANAAAIEAYKFIKEHHDDWQAYKNRIEQFSPENAANLANILAGKMQSPTAKNTQERGKRVNMDDANRILNRLELAIASYDERTTREEVKRAISADIQRMKQKDGLTSDQKMRYGEILRSFQIKVA